MGLFTVLATGILSAKVRFGIHACKAELLLVWGV